MARLSELFTEFIYEDHALYGFRTGTIRESVVVVSSASWLHPAEVIAIARALNAALKAERKEGK